MTTKDLPLTKSVCTSRRGKLEIEPGVVLPAGTFVFKNEAGRATNDISGGTNVFAGIVLKRGDSTKGDQEVEFETAGIFTISATEFTAENHGRFVYAVDNENLVATEDGNSQIGVVIKATAKAIEVLLTAPSNSE